MSDSIRFIDLFGGIGGFRLGLEHASDRYECVDYIEYDDYAVNSYNEIFEEEHEPKDVTELDTKQIPEHDLICAGFPCQAFSVAGNREGTDDSRGKLFREIVRIAEAHQPQMLLLENVKGLLSQKAVQDGESVKGTKGHAFREILSSLHELGYCLEWRVLNSKNWGVPQNRERVFIVGHLGGEPEEKVFPLPREDREDTGEDGREIEEIANRYGKGKQDGGVYSKSGITPCLQKSKGGPNPFMIAEGLNTTSEGDSFCIDASYWKGVSPSSIEKGRRTQIVQNGTSGGVSRKENIDQEDSSNSIVNPLQGLTENSWYWEQIVYSQDTSLVRALKKNNAKMQPKVIDETYGFDDVRQYDELVPNLRSERTGLKIINHQMRPESRPSIQNGQSGGSGILFNDTYSYALSSSPHFVKSDPVKPVHTPEFAEKDMNMKSRVGSSDGSMFTVDGSSQHGILIDDMWQGDVREYSDYSPSVTAHDTGGWEDIKHLEWTPLQRKRTEKAKEIRREHRREHGEDYSPMSEYKFGLKEDTDVFHTVTARPEKSHKLKKDAQIRKLTPRECWRLQGFPDWAFNAAQKENSDTQLYKQAGNSVTVNVIEVLGERIEKIS